MEMLECIWSGEKTELEIGLLCIFEGQKHEKLLSTNELNVAVIVGRIFSL